MTEEFDFHTPPRRPATLADIQAWMMEGANEAEIAGAAGISKRLARQLMARAAAELPV
jgi:DNA-binding CsgD family transcriptional regulator